MRGKKLKVKSYAVVKHGGPVKYYESGIYWEPDYFVPSP